MCICNTSPLGPCLRTHDLLPKLNRSRPFTLRPFAFAFGFAAGMAPRPRGFRPMAVVNRKARREPSPEADQVEEPCPDALRSYRDWVRHARKGWARRLRGADGDEGPASIAASKMLRGMRPKQSTIIYLSRRCGILQNACN